jgi:hypothetical protein
VNTAALILSQMDRLQRSTRSSTGAMPEALDQLDELLVSLGSTTTK